MKMCRGSAGGFLLIFVFAPIHGIQATEMSPNLPEAVQLLQHCQNEKEALGQQLSENFDGLQATSSKLMNNIGYVLKGYDIMKGNPLNVEGLPIDPCFREPIFKATYESGMKTPDRRYFVPDGTSITDCTGTCSLSFGSRFISGTKSYSNSLGRKVSVGVSGYDAAFSASVDYKKVKSTTKNNENFFTHSDASCCAYLAQTLTFAPPPLSANFIAAVKSLPETYKKAKYQKFIRVFGTHYIAEARMGAHFGQQTQLSKTTWTAMLEEGFDIRTAASYSAAGITASAKFINSQNMKVAESFVLKASEQKTYTIGAMPPADGNMTTWVQSTKTNPAPISLRLTSIVELLQGSHGVKNVSNDVQDNLQKALDNYCGYLIEHNQVSTCEKPKDDPPFPKPTKKRTWTAWSNGNTNGFQNPVCECAEGQYVSHITWREQTGYGFVNLIFKCSDGKTCQMNTNNNGSPATPMTCSGTPGGFRQMSGMEEHFYGIVNAKGFCLNKQIQQTASNNYNGFWNTTLKCKKGQIIVGIQTREQHFYGIINFRIKCA